MSIFLICSIMICNSLKFFFYFSKNEDGNIEVYEEQVNQITITPENADFAKEKVIVILLSQL